MFIICFALATAHTAENSYGRQPDTEVAKVRGLAPPGLWHQCIKPYRSHLLKDGYRYEGTKNIEPNIIKVENPTAGLRIATINVTSWSPKIVTYMAKFAKEYDIIPIQEHHKMRATDMRTGPYIIARQPNAPCSNRMVKIGIPREV